MLLHTCVSLGGSAESPCVISLLYSALQDCIRAGVTKFNVNTEVRAAYLESLRQHSGSGDLVDVMRAATQAMQTVVADKMRMFGSAGKAT
jgi:fructose/tagatose bisphosphate aldolase